MRYANIPSVGGDGELSTMLICVWRENESEKERKKIGGVPTSHVLLPNCVSYMVRYIFSLSVHYLFGNIMLKTSYLYLSTAVNLLNCILAMRPPAYDMSMYYEAIILRDY